VLEDVSKSVLGRKPSR